MVVGVACDWGWEGKDGIHVVLAEEVTAGAKADEDRAAVAIVEDGADVVKEAPAGDEVVFVAVVLDMRDARGGIGGEGEEGVVEVAGCGAEGVDFLDVVEVGLVRFLTILLKGGWGRLRVWRLWMGEGWRRGGLGPWRR